VTATIEDNDIEDRFIAEWHRRYDAVRNREERTDSVDIGSLVDGMRTVVVYQLAARGLK
jgi:hypothetical protein